MTLQGAEYPCSERLMYKLRGFQASFAPAHHGSGVCTSARSISPILIGPPRPSHSGPTWHLDNSATSAPICSLSAFAYILFSPELFSSHRKEQTGIRWEGKRARHQLACLDCHGTEGRGWYKSKGCPTSRLDFRTRVGVLGVSQRHKIPTPPRELLASSQQPQSLQIPVCCRAEQ